MLVSIVCVSEYWRRHRRGPFQFGLRTLLLVTAVFAVFIAMIENRVLDWWSLLNLPIALGLASLPTAVGLALERVVRRSDQRLSRLRSRYNTMEAERGIDTQQ